MPNKVPPAGSQPASPDEPSKAGSKTGDQPSMSGAQGKQTLNDLLAEFSPEQKRKFLNLMTQNITRQIQKDQKKMIEEIRKERENIEKGE